MCVCACVFVYVCVCVSVHVSVCLCVCCTYVHMYMDAGLVMCTVLIVCFLYKDQSVCSYSMCMQFSAGVLSFKFDSCYNCCVLLAGCEIPTHVTVNHTLTRICRYVMGKVSKCTLCFRSFC